MNPLIQEIQTSLLQLIGKSVQALPAFAIAILVLMGTSYAAQVTRRVVAVAGDRMIRHQSLRSLLIQISFVAAWVVGVLIASVIAFPSLRLGDIVGLLGLSSVAIGFAFQDIFKNFLAGVLLLLNEPFRLRDQIIVNEFEGTVEEIAIRSTQIRTYQGERIVLPNAIVFTSPVKVLTALPHRRTDLKIGVDYNTSLPHAVATLLKAVKQAEGVLASPEAEVDVVGFGDSSIDLIVRYWTLPQKVHVRRTQTQVMMALKEACDRANINIPYPIRTLYHFDQQRFNDHYPVSVNGDLS
jgi:small-conductance mechanosensitive channel